MIRTFSMIVWFAFLSALARQAPAQEGQQAVSPGTIPNQVMLDADATSLRSTRAKFDNFRKETVGPLTWGGGAFNALFSQVTDTDPKYGVNRVALGKRFGASLADIASENFFGDFVVASALHEDPRYRRMGEGHSFWHRFGYALSRAVVVRKDNGTGNTFNFDNVLGSAASSAFSNIYYPPASRTRGAFLMHFWTDVADYGFVNLAPEFWPDFKRKVFGREKHD
jgi:hypothetical protein